MQMNHYSRLLLMITLHFIAMYIFMYAMVNEFGNVKDLCKNIIMSQQAEIDQMKTKLDQLNG